jgi:anti-anti-sigma factor
VATAPNFRIDTLESESGPTIKLAGELDSATSVELLNRFERAIAQPGVRRLVLDLEAVSFIDSAGMRAIIVIERAASEREVMLSISPPPPEVTDLLRLTGIADLVALSPRTDDVPPSTSFIERIDIELARDSSAPGRARAELRDVLRPRLPDADLATVTLLTSELVTNAVLHPGAVGGSSIGLRITSYSDRVRIEVTDAGSGFEVESLPPRPREAGGHGLIVVEGLSSRWGTGRRAAVGGDEFCVWFDLDVLERVSTLSEPASAVSADESAQPSVPSGGG